MVGGKVVGASVVVTGDTVVVSKPSTMFGVLGVVAGASVVVSVSVSGSNINSELLMDLLYSLLRNLKLHYQLDR